jgi:hypothetical protein
VLKGVGSGWRGLLLPVLLSALLLVAIPLDLFPWLRGPAPYPPEWQWGFRAGPTGAWLPAVLVAATVLGLIAACASSWARRRPRFTGGALLTAGGLAGWAFQIALAATLPEGALRTLLNRAASRTITSYHSVAISEDARDPLAFLAHHAEHLAEYRTTAKHAATHPPGPVLFYRAALWACERSPWLTEALLDKAGLPDRDFAPPNTRTARAAALLGALLLGLLGAATIFPVAALAETLGLGPLAATQVGLLYVLLPGPALMVPQFDAALALPVAAATALLASAIATGRGVMLKAVGAGVLAALALFTSYGAAVFLAISGLAALTMAPSRRDATRTGLPTLLIATSTATFLTAATTLLGHDPLASARAALAIHREVYTAPRSYALWLAFNPLDLALFLGAPIAALGLVRLASGPSGLRRGPLGPRQRFGLTLVVALVALIASGTTRGEVGRIWIPLMPLLLVGILAPSDRTSADADADPSQRRPFLLVLGALLAALCLAIRVCWDL